MAAVWRARGGWRVPWQFAPHRSAPFFSSATLATESEVNLRGMRAIVDTYRGKLKAIVVLDGSAPTPSTDHVTTKALALAFFEALITGPSAIVGRLFGHAHSHQRFVGLVRGLRAHSSNQSVQPPSHPRSTWPNRSGTSLNAVP